MALTISGCGKQNPQPEPGGNEPGEQEPGEQEPGEKEQEQHTHRYDLENVEWFWKQLQNKDYEAKATFYCLDCEEGTEGHSVTKEATVNKEHTRTATCSTNGLYTYTASVYFQGQQFTETKTREYSDENAHHYVEVKEDQYLLSEANCEEDAVYYVSCEHCHEKGTETFTDVGSKLGHNLVHHDAKTSTCQEHGNIAYYQCSRCNKYFLSEDGEPVNYSEIELPLSHNMTYHAGDNPSCSSVGHKGYYTCEYEPGVKYYDEEGENLVESDDDLIISALGHDFKEDGTCNRCDSTIKEAYGLEDCTMEDEMVPTTLSNIGISNNTSIPIHTIGHIFKQFDFVANKGIDLWFTYNYKYAAGDSQIAVYLFNQNDESGVRFRIDTNRAANDGISAGYIISGSSTDHVIFPQTANIKEDEEITVHIFAYLINEENNTFKVGYQAGVGQVYNPVDYDTGDGSETGSPLYTKEFTLGADYFNGTSHRTIRFSAMNNSNIKISSTVSQDKTVIYKSADGTIMGKKSGESIDLFKYEITGKHLVGWFDQSGARVVNGQELTTKTFVYPYFVDVHDDMVTPSTTQVYGEGETAVVNPTTVPAELGSMIGYEPSGNRIDYYFIYQPVSRGSGDKYAIFGFPYDFIDAKSRLFVRIDENDDNFHGYIYGGSLGGAGADGTFFNYGAGFRVLGDYIHIHFAVIYNGNNNIDVTIEMTNLRTRQMISLERNVTFEDYDMHEAVRNKMSFLVINQLEYRISDGL